MYFVASSIPGPSQWFIEGREMQRRMAQWDTDENRLDLVSNLYWNGVTQRQSVLSLFLKSPPISFAELSQLWLEMRKIYQNTKNASRIGQACRPWEEQLSPLLEDKVRCVLTCAGVEGLSWRRLSREIDSESPLKGCQREPSHWESPRNMKGLLSRNSLWYFTCRHTADFNTSTS